MKLSNMEANLSSLERQDSETSKGKRRYMPQDDNSQELDSSCQLFARYVIK
jgi:hypothetical protein